MKKWRNDGEHCTIDDSFLNKFDVAMLKEFLTDTITQSMEVGKQKGIKELAEKVRFSVLPADDIIFEERLKKVIKSLSPKL